MRDILKLSPLALALTAVPAFAQEGAGEAAEVPAAAAAVNDKGDVARMIVATIQVLQIIFPGLALL